jgi:hypothetical protein
MYDVENEACPQYFVLFIFPCQSGGVMLKYS